MTIKLKCPYCGVPNHYRINDQFEIPPGNRFRDAASLKCASCGSVCKLDLNIRRGRKSAVVKKAEQERNAKVEVRAKELFAQSERAGSGTATWETINSWERDNLRGQAYRELFGNT